MAVKMKILIIHSFFSSEGARGAEIIAQDTYKLLKEAGNEVYFFATDKPPYLEDAEWTKYFPIYYSKFTHKYFWNMEAQKNMELFLDAVKPDIVHVHGTHCLSYSIFKPIFDKKIPVVMTVHDTGVLCPVHFGWDTDKKLICRKCKGLNTIPCIIKNCVFTKKRLSSFNMAFANFLEKISGYNRKIEKFIVPSEALGNYIECKDIPKNKIEVIPNFLNKNFINKINNSDNREYFLYVGTLADYKGVNILLKVIQSLPIEIPFKIVGSGPDEEKYKSFVKENKIFNVEFTGNLDRESIIKYYKNSIALIVPSNYFEIFGMINLEAFAYSKPVIASKIGGIPEIVEHGKTGFLFEPANVGQLKDCILKYWNNKHLAAEHGKNGYNKVRNKYSEEKYLNDLTRLYNKVLRKDDNDTNI